MTQAEEQPEVWARLVAGRSLEGLGLAVRDGRFDLSGFVVGASSVSAGMERPPATGEASGPIRAVEGVTWRGIDFSGSDLRELRFRKCRLEDCIFDRCDCHDWRMWETTVERCRFCETDLRHAALGGLVEKRRNTFREVEFERTDLRGSAYLAAEFIGCRFVNSKLKGVNFRQSSFEDCRFEGRLAEVCFSRDWLGREDVPFNDMRRIDMTRAELRFVEFRNLGLEGVDLPRDDDHVVIGGCPASLDELLDVFRFRSDTPGLAILGYFESARKWAGQRVVFNKRDIVEFAGEEALAEVLSVVGKFTEKGG